MIAAAYLRKSTDEGEKHADAKSVTRQLEHSRAFVASHQGTFLEDHVYVDDGISGAEYEKRPGLQRLLAALTPKPAFDTLVVSEVSRLGRDTVMNLMVIKRLRDAGITIVSYLDGREVSLDDEQGEMNAFLQSMLASGERRKAAQRSTDKFKQQARLGVVTGGRTFGYLNVKNGHGYVDRTIHESEAAVVFQIFTRFAEGQGLKKIAAALNAASAPAPRPSQRGQPAWSPSTIKAILSRELYAGQVVLNKRKKRDRNGQHRVTKRPPSEWITVPRPDLTIIEGILWTKVQQRLAENAGAYLRSPDGKLRGRPTGSGPTIHYLLTGLGVCSVCQGSMAIRTSGGLPRRAWLECLRYRTKGQRACSNRLRVALSVAEEAILAKMEQDLFRPDVLLAAVQRVLATVTPSPAALERERARLKRQVLTTERELTNLGAAVAAGGQLETLLSQLKDREVALAGLRATLTRLDAQETLAQLDPAALEARLRAKLADFTGLRQRHPAAARSLLKKVIPGRLTFTPITGPDRAYYRVEWEAAFGGLLSEELAALAPRTHDRASFIGGDPGGFLAVVWLRDRRGSCRVGDRAVWPSGAAAS